MERIVLNDRHKDLLKIFLIESKDIFDYEEEEMNVGNEVFDMVEKLKRELNAFNESGTYPMAWFWGKYLKQEGLYKLDDISKVILNKKELSMLKAAAKGEYMAALLDDKTNDEYFEVLCKICSFIAETNAYKEINDSDLDYHRWFLDKYIKYHEKK